MGWSPEMISGKLKKDHYQNISYECIYQYIYGKNAKDKGYKLEKERHWGILMKENEVEKKHQFDFNHQKNYHTIQN